MINIHEMSTAIFNLEKYFFYYKSNLKYTVDFGVIYFESKKNWSSFQVWRLCLHVCLFVELLNKWADLGKS